MIAFLATSERAAREILWDQFRHEVRGSDWGVFAEHRSEYGIDKPIGYIATREDHLRGMELSGFILLEPVRRDLLIMVSARVRKSLTGAAVAPET